MKRKATEDAGLQRPKGVVNQSLGEKARLQRLRVAACRRSASAPVRLAVAEARAARQASTEFRQVQAKQIKAAKQAAKFNRKVAKAAAAAAKQAAEFDQKVATAAAAVDRELTRAARQSAAAITKAAKALLLRVMNISPSQKKNQKKQQRPLPDNRSGAANTHCLTLPGKACTSKHIM